MSRKNPGSPRLTDLNLADLEPGDPAEARPGTRVEGFAFRNADFSDRPLTGATFAECIFIDVSLHNAVLAGASFLQSRFERLGAPVLSAPRSRFHGVELEASRIGAAELYESEWDGVLVRGCKLGFVNLRGAELTDVLFVDCTIEELDLGQARAARVSFADCVIDSLDVASAELKSLDLRGARLSRVAGLGSLRGAIVSPTQAAELSEAMAHQLGIEVLD